jgi:hypothetical protein
MKNFFGLAKGDVQEKVVRGILILFAFTVFYVLFYHLWWIFLISGILLFAVLLNASCVKYSWRLIGLGSLALVSVAPLRQHYSFEVQSVPCIFKQQYVLVPKAFGIESGQPYLVMSVTDRSKQWNFKPFWEYNKPKERIARLQYQSEQYGAALWTNPLVASEFAFDQTTFNHKNTTAIMDITLFFGPMPEAQLSNAGINTPKVRSSDVNEVNFKYEDCDSISAKRVNAIPQGTSLIRPLITFALDKVGNESQAWEWSRAGIFLIVICICCELTHQRLEWVARRTRADSDSIGFRSADQSLEGKVSDKPSNIVSLKTTKGEILDKSSIDQSKKEKPMPIALGDVPIRTDGNLITFYVRQVLGRFKFGRTTETEKARQELLKQKTEIGKIWIEHQRVQGEASRVQVEEETATERARAAYSRIKDESELEILKIEAEKEEARLKKDEAQKKREDLKKPAPPDPKISSEEKKREERQRIEQRIATLTNGILTTKADPTLQEEIKRAKLNALYHELTLAEAERASLL